MKLPVTRFVSVLFAVLAMTTGFAHLFEIPNKMKFAGPDYLKVQQIYRGWALLGILPILAIVSTLTLLIAVRRRRPAMLYAAVAFASLLGTQLIFWIYTYPVNAITRNWTWLPDNWTQLRVRWEYSHGASAALELIAVVALLLLISRTGAEQPDPRKP